MIYVIIAAILVAADQITKFAIKHFISDGHTVNVINGVVNFIYVENRGAAFGIMQNTRWMLVAMTLFILIALIGYITFTKKRHPLLLSAASLIVAGGVGNLIDRVFFGYVTDFIHTVFMDFPCFNLADICVCVGGALLIIYLFLPEKSAQKGDRNEPRNSI